MVKTEGKKKAYREPEVTLVRFSTEDVLSPSDLPPVGEGETPVVIF